MPPRFNFHTRHTDIDRRAVAPLLAADDSADGQVFPLLMAGEGRKVRICLLQGGKSLVMRLTELGLNQGCEVRVVQRQHGGLIVARGETRIALGGGMASKILVTEVEA